MDSLAILVVPTCGQSECVSVRVALNISAADANVDRFWRVLAGNMWEPMACRRYCPLKPGSSLSLHLRTRVGTWSASVRSGGRRVITHTLWMKIGLWYRKHRRTPLL